MKNIIEDLNWRYATKKFDPTKKMSQEQLDTILEVLRLTPTSYGLQPFKFLVVENVEIREKLKEKSWGQSQVTDASHLIILCSYLDLTEIHIDDHIENTVNMRQLEHTTLTGYSNFMKSTINKLESLTKQEWNKKQVYIALGLLINACAKLRIDLTPMEGFDIDSVDDILHLKERNLTATILCPIGFRSEDDTTQHLKKVRKSHEDLVEFIR
jgi:nitroreductase